MRSREDLGKEVVELRKNSNDNWALADRRGRALSDLLGNLKKIEVNTITRLALDKLIADAEKIVK